MKTRTVLALSLLLVSFASQRPAGARAQEMPRPRPDLATRAASIEDYKVVAVVGNFGKAPSGVCVIRLDIVDAGDPKTILKTMEAAVPAIAQGTNYYATFDTAPQKAKGNVIRLWVDPSDRVRESDEYNNRAMDTSTVVKPPQPGAGGGFPKPGAPDLIVKAVAGTPSSKKSLRVEVANVGGVASAPCKLTLYIFSAGEVSRKDLVEARSFDVPALQPDETKWVLVEAGTDFEQSDHKNNVTPLLTLHLVIDAMNVVKEYKENNNSLTLKVQQPQVPYKP